MRVLQSQTEIAQARKDMVAAQISAIDRSLIGTTNRLLKRVGLGTALVIGDYVKSWDVLNTVRFLEENVRKTDHILDLGAYASEVIVALRRAGFGQLTGIDLNPRISEMPLGDSIRYEVGDFNNPPFKDAYFSAITSISVIEHGYNGPALLSNVSRMLAEGGFFIASFDYWPEKIDTTGVEFFGLDWRIFSREEIESLLEEASKYGLYPCGDVNFEAREKAVSHGGYKYTFGWLVLQKRG